jgi:hypothetical protein
MDGDAVDVTDRPDGNPAQLPPVEPREEQGREVEGRDEPGGEARP